MAVAKIQADHLADLERVQAEKNAVATTAAEQADELERTRQELAQARADAQHAGELAEAGRQMLRQELERLTDQVGELKSALYQRAKSSAS